MYNNFKCFGKCFGKGDICLINPSLKMENKEVCFQRIGKIRCDKFRLHIHLGTGIRTSEQPFVIETGIPYRLVNVSVTDRFHV